MNHDHQREGNQGTDSRWKWALAGFLAVGAFFLWTEHRAHLLGALPYLLILACPLMHMFHHGGHRHGHHHQGATDGPDVKRQASKAGEQS